MLDWTYILAYNVPHRHPLTEQLLSQFSQFRKHVLHELGVAVPPHRFPLPGRCAFPAGTVEWRKHNAQVQHWIYATLYFNLNGKSQFQSNKNKFFLLIRALTDLHMTRLTGNDTNLKAKLLSTVKKCIETRHPDFLGDHQQVREINNWTHMFKYMILRLAFDLIILRSFFSQDAHEFLMVCLSHLKEEGELLQSYWPQYTCPVANMEFQLKRRRTCDR